MSYFNTLSYFNRERTRRETCPKCHGEARTTVGEFMTLPCIECRGVGVIDQPIPDIKVLDQTDRSVTIGGIIGNTRSDVRVNVSTGDSFKKGGWSWEM